MITLHLYATGTFSLVTGGLFGVILYQMRKKHPSGGSQSQLNVDSCRLLFIIMLINWLQEFSYLALISMLLQ